MYCLNCGKPVRDGEIICPYCGLRADQPDTSVNTTNNSYPAQPVQQHSAQLPSSGEVSAYPAAPVRYTQARSGGSGALVGVLAASGVILAISCVLLFGKPGYLRQSDVEISSGDTESEVYSSDISGSSEVGSLKRESSKTAAHSDTESSKAASSKSESSKVTSSKSESSKAASSKAASSKSESSKAVSSKEEKPAESRQETVPKPDPQPQPQPEPEPEPQSQPEFVPQPEPEYDPNKHAYSEAMVYSTYERPTFDEFEWCIGQNGLVYEPSGGTPLTNVIGYSGGWKCMIVYNPSNIEGTFIRELDNVDITVDGAIVNLKIDWYLMSNDSQAGALNEEDMPDVMFTGGSIGGVVSVSSGETNTSIEMKYFWKDSGKEYALGTMQLADGLSAYVAFVR